MYEVLEVAGEGDWVGRVVDLGIILLVAANVAATILESVEGIYRGYRGAFDRFEVLSVSVFAVEYALRIWVAPETPGARAPWRARLRWALTPLAIADLGAILPFFLGPLIGYDLRVLRVLRLVRVLKLTRYYGSLTLIFGAIRAQRRAYGASLFLLGVLLVLAASGIYLTEHDAQPEAFGSIPAAMWWALVTLTIVGYGDVTPVTALGKLFAASVTVVGVGVVALPTGILASGFLDSFQRNRDQLQEDAERASADGHWTRAEREAFDARAERLGIVPETAHEIMEAAARHPLRPDACPHCGKELSPP